MPKILQCDHEDCWKPGEECVGEWEEIFGEQDYPPEYYEYEE